MAGYKAPTRAAPSRQRRKTVLEPTPDYALSGHDRLENAHCEEEASKKEAEEKKNAERKAAKKKKEESLKKAARPTHVFHKRPPPSKGDVKKSMKGTTHQVDL